jgi:hypothetical protein
METFMSYLELPTSCSYVGQQVVSVLAKSFSNYLSPCKRFPKAAQAAPRSILNPVPAFKSGGI